jgi:hypothetical protein
VSNPGPANRVEIQQMEIVADEKMSPLFLSYIAGNGRINIKCTD